MRRRTFPGKRSTISHVRQHLTTGINSSKLPRWNPVVEEVTILTSRGVSHKIVASLEMCTFFQRLCWYARPASAYSSGASEPWPQNKYHEISRSTPAALTTSHPLFSSSRSKLLFTLLLSQASLTFEDYFDLSSFIIHHPIMAKTIYSNHSLEFREFHHNNYLHLIEL